MVILFTAGHAQADTNVKAAANNRYIKVIKGHSYPLGLANNIETLAIGDPNIIQVATLKPNMIMISGLATGSTSLTIFNTDNRHTTYVVQVANDTTILKSLLYQIEPNVYVENMGDVIVLKGSVKSAAALSRVLTIADRFVNNSDEPNFSVISDKGGVLTGNPDQSEDVDPVQLRLSLQTLAMGRGGAGGMGGGAGTGGGAGGGAGGLRGGGGAAASLRQPLYPNKGNLAQNISRGDVITVANGKVMSLIKVESQPKVEIQMQIVAVDRNKTDELGWDWRLTSIIENGGRTTGVTIGSLLGGVSPSVGSGIATTATPATTGSTTTGTNNNSATNVGTSTIAGLLTYTNPAQGITLGLVNFLKLIEEKGAGATLSEPLVTALSGESASFLVGGSLPIPVQAISAGSATQNAVVATNVRFIQFGLSLIVRPTVLENGKISIVLDQSISEPDFTNAFTLMGAPIPAFKQKTVSTLTESASGETWAVAGLLTEEDTKKLSEVPFFAQLPVLGNLFKKKNNKVSRNELFIVVNARRVDGVNETTQNFNESGNLKPSNNAYGVESADADHPDLSSDEIDITSDKKISSQKIQPTKHSSGKKQKISTETQKSPRIVNGLPKKDLIQANASTGSPQHEKLSQAKKAPITDTISISVRQSTEENVSSQPAASTIHAPATNTNDTEHAGFDTESELFQKPVSIELPATLQHQNNSSSLKLMNSLATQLQG